MFYLCLVPRVQKMIWIESNPIFYLFSLTNETLNLLPSKKPTNSSHLNSVIFSYWIHWTFSAEQHVLIHSWRHKKHQKQKVLPYEKLDHSGRMQNTDLPPFDGFHGKLRTFNPLEAEHTDYIEKWIDHRTSSYQIKTIKATLTGIEIYQYLQQLWKQEQVSSFKVFLRWCISHDVLPTLGALHKMFSFHHGKEIEMLKLGRLLPNLANIYLNKSTDAKIYPFKEG